MASDQDKNQLFCAHCGTANEADAYSCDRCGERIYLPDPMSPPPLGLAECPKCVTPNEARATYCVKCGSSMVNAARINVLGGGETGRQTPHARPGGIRVSPGARDRPRTATGERQQGTRSPADNQRAAAERARREEERAAFERERERVSAERRARDEQERKDREWARSRAGERQREQSESEPEVNDSGTRSAKLPRSARGWNTAAFLLGPVWGPANGVWIGVIGLAFFFLFFLDMPTRMILYLAFGAVLGLKGNEMAWRAKRWSSIESFKKIQQQWMMFALIVNIGLLIGVAALVAND